MRIALSQLRVYGVTAIAALALAACSSPEKPAGGTPAPAANPAPAAPAAPPRPVSVEGYPEVPSPAGEWTNKVGDLQRDLQNLTAAGRGAAKDFSDDLDAMFESSEIKAKPATIQAVGRELAAVMPKASNPDPLHARLAQLLFVATRRAAVPAERITALEGEVTKLLTDHAVPEPRAKTIAGLIATIARDARRPA